MAAKRDERESRHESDIAKVFERPAVAEVISRERKNGERERGF